MTTKELRVLLRPPIAFNRAFVDVAGNAAGGLFLSQAVYWSGKAADRDGEFWKTRDEWTAETGLSRWEQERARRQLRGLGVLKEREDRLRHRLHFRLDLDRLAELLNSMAERQGASPAEAVSPSRRRPCNHRGGGRVTADSEETTSKTTSPPNPPEGGGVMAPTAAPTAEAVDGGTALASGPTTTDTSFSATVTVVGPASGSHAAGFVERAKGSHAPPKITGQWAWNTWVEANVGAGKSPPARTRKDFRAAKELTKFVYTDEIDRDEISDIFGAYLDDPDTFLEKFGHALHLLPQRLNKYLNDIRDDDAQYAVAFDSYRRRTEEDGK